jgi:hypothetical protein
MPSHKAHAELFECIPPPLPPWPRACYQVKLCPCFICSLTPYSEGLTLQLRLNEKINSIFCQKIEIYLILCVLNRSGCHTIWLLDSLVSGDSIAKYLPPHISYMPSIHVDKLLVILVFCKVSKFFQIFKGKGIECLLSYLLRV